MAILHDFHLHTSFSGDSTTPMEDMFASAIDKGLAGLCITEHYDKDYDVCEQCPKDTFLLDFDGYYKRFFELKPLFQDKLDLCFGIEIGLQPHLTEHHKEVIQNHPYDFVIGSVHTCHSRDPYFPPFYYGREEEECYREYFTCILENLELYDDFDTFGHLDYVVRYGPNKDKFYTFERYQDLIDPILMKLISMGKALECNTGAINYGLKDLNPSNAVLKRYRALGGEMITVGSDAHRPDPIAKGFDRAADVLKECGFHYYTTFKERKPRMHKI